MTTHSVSLAALLFGRLRLCFGIAAASVIIVLPHHAFASGTPQNAPISASQSRIPVTHHRTPHFQVLNRPKTSELPNREIGSDKASSNKIDK